MHRLLLPVHKICDIERNGSIHFLAFTKSCGHTPPSHRRSVHAESICLEKGGNAMLFLRKNHPQKNVENYSAKGGEQGDNGIKRTN